MKIISESFALINHPFLEHTARAQMVMDPRFELGLQGCQVFAEQGSLALLYGPTGVGKTFLLNVWIGRLPVPNYWPVYLPLCSINSTGILRMICVKLGERPSVGKDRLMLQIVRKIEHSERQVILILDEAHLLTPDSLTDLRILLSMPQVKTVEPLKLILSGQPRLEGIVKCEALADLHNRISMRISLHALTPQQTVAYIDQRLSFCGGSADLFDASAKELIHNCTGGIPRQINQLATMALLHAARRSLKNIDQAVVSAAASDLRYI